MQRGFLKTIILLVIALALLKIVWGFDVVKFLDKPQVKEVWETILNFIKSSWEYVKGWFN